MLKVEIRLKVDSIRDSEIFYCNELGLFQFEKDFGMGTISLTLKENPCFRILLSTGLFQFSEEYLFGIETENCNNQFNRLKKVEFNTGGKLINDDIFEYPLGKSFALIDPSRHRFLIFEEYKT